MQVSVQYNKSGIILDILHLEISEICDCGVLFLLVNQGESYYQPVLSLPLPFTCCNIIACR